jgi:DNA-binding transcriptional regulator YiaG
MVRMTKQDVVRIRRKLEVTQAGLAELLGVHPMTVSRWERGAGNVPSTAARLLKMLADRKAKAGRGKR